MFAAIAICLGASVGAMSRWGLGLWLSPGGAIPWGTLAANLIGGYLFGFCVAVFQALPQLDPAWRLALVTGGLGGLTTFSGNLATAAGTFVTGTAYRGAAAPSGTKWWLGWTDYAIN